VAQPKRSAGWVSEANKKPQKKRRHFLSRGDYDVASCRALHDPKELLMRTRAAILITLLAAAALLIAVFQGNHKTTILAEDVPPAPTPAQPNNDTAPPKTETLREPAVADSFYPKDKGQLLHSIDSYLELAPDESISNLRALVCPHAGYIYSGPVAAFSYKQLLKSDFRTVIIMGPSHFSLFDGAFIAPVDGFKTPLGTARLADYAAKLAQTAPFVTSPLFQTDQRVPGGADRPDQFEHSIEVQIPFLQRVLKNEFKIVPIMFGEVEPEAVAGALIGHLDDSTLIIVSSDLSHYHPYDQARLLDTATVKAICELDAETLRQRDKEACGKGPILALLDIAKKKGWKTKLLDYRNSGDVTGDKRRGVVGYSAIAFYEEKAPAPAGGAFSAAERKFMLNLARQSLTSAANRTSRPAPEEKTLPVKLKEDGACFVTYTIDGELRGCIGHLSAVEPLYQSIIENANHAAVQDTRFPQVRPEEVDKIRIEISVLTKPEPLLFSSPEDLLNKLKPNVDGVILIMNGRRSTFLPQVWEQLSDKEEFLEHLSQKAGCPADQWRKPGTHVSIYHVEAWKE
jgi:AmmeMemoRadiSam system protein B/AmmeMemoRadiSam system protein A